MFTILIPIGNYPDIAQILIQNIKSVCDENIEIIFLSTKEIDIDARVEVIPFEDKEGVHLKLLDWAFENLNFEWGYVQHADMFWQPCNISLFEDIKNQFGSEIALTIPHHLSDGEFKFKEFKFTIDGKPSLRTHDFAGFYNRERMLKYGFKFMWGTIQQIGSNELKNAVNHNRLSWIHRNSFVKADDFIDGSDSIGLEIALRFPEKIKELSMNNRYIHCWDMFAFCMNMRREGVTLHIDRPLKRCLRGLPTYSWISSHLFDVKSMKDKIFPWDVLNKIMPCKKPKICELLSSNKICNVGSLGIRQVVFEDYIYRDSFL